MAFFAGRGELDKNDHGAFHINCGENLTFSNGRQNARISIHCEGIVFSAKPIQIGGMFQVKLLKKGYNIFALVSNL